MVRSQFSICGNCDGQGSVATNVYPRNSVLLCQFYFTHAPCHLLFLFATTTICNVPQNTPTRGKALSYTPYLLTPWGRVLLEKLTGFQLLKKLPEFYGTRRFITAFTRARHMSLSWASSIQSTSWRPILILPSHLLLGLLSGLFPSRFPTKTLYTPILSPYTRYMTRRSHSFRFYHPNNIRWAVQIIKLLIM